MRFSPLFATLLGTAFVSPPSFADEPEGQKLVLSPPVSEGMSSEAEVLLRKRLMLAGFGTFVVGVAGGGYLLHRAGEDEKEADAIRAELRGSDCVAPAANIAQKCSGLADAVAAQRTKEMWGGMALTAGLLGGVGLAFMYLYWGPPKPPERTVVVVPLGLGLAAEGTF